MNMRSKIILGAFITFSALNTYATEMNAGTVHFTGEIIEPSCTIKGDDGTDSTVPLGTYPTSLFDTVGTESPLVFFSITLQDCPLKSDGLPSVQLTFTGKTTLTGTEDLLDVSMIKTAGTTAATGVGIAVSQEGHDTELITMNGATDQIYVDLSNKPDDVLTTNFNARYKSFAETVTAGPADADMTVNIIYR